MASIPIVDPDLRPFEVGFEDNDDLGIALVEVAARMKFLLMIEEVIVWSMYTLRRMFL